MTTAQKRARKLLTSYFDLHSGDGTEYVFVRDKKERLWAVGYAFLYRLEGRGAPMSYCSMQHHLTWPSHPMEDIILAKALMVQHAPTVRQMKVSGAYHFGEFPRWFHIPEGV